MDRLKFIRTCGLACLGAATLPIFLQSCATHYYASNELLENKLKVKKTEFEKSSNGGIAYRKYVLVKSDKLEVPIFLSRQNDSDYSALWMQCTHQFAELSAHGEVLTCASHGSEFDNRGNVLQGPAEKPLRKFTTTTDNDYIYILLN